MTATTTSQNPAERAGTLTTASLSDALDRLGIAGQVVGVRPVDPSFRLCGPAYTVKYRPVRVVGETVGDYIDDVPEGSVVVIDNAGRTDCTVWGDILTETARSRGVAGTVIDGTCRDADWSVHLQYPVFAAATWMRTGKDRVTVESVQATVQVGGVTVAPGDVLVGDRDGVVVLPADRVLEVIALAETIESTEDQIRLAVRAGERLAEARARLGYHLLQRQTDGGSPAARNQSQR
jgi:4-hydroxy-4-methyl-2-oxoglutarate aldolase